MIMDVTMEMLGVCRVLGRDQMHSKALFMEEPATFIEENACMGCHLRLINTTGKEVKGKDKVIKNLWH